MLQKTKGFASCALLFLAVKFTFLFLLHLAPAHSPAWIYVPSSLGTAEDRGCKTPNLIVSTVPLLMLSWGDFYCDLHFCLIYGENISL